MKVPQIFVSLSLHPIIIESGKVLDISSTRVLTTELNIMLFDDSKIDGAIFFVNSDTLRQLVLSSNNSGRFSVVSLLSTLLSTSQDSHEEETFTCKQKRSVPVISAYVVSIYLMESYQSNPAKSL